MEKRIELERRARKANMISELNLDNCRSTSIVGLTDEYTALETLSLINVGLTTLKGFPKLPNLQKLELSDNRISNGLNYLTTSPLLQSLNLSGNKIKTLETLEPLKEFKNLTVLDLFNNEVTTVENYRQKIFQMLPSLMFLDGFDCNDVEPRSDEEEDVNGNDSEDEVSDNIGEDDDDSDECEEDDDDDEDGDGEGDADADGDGDSENDNDVSLAEVYNDDIEEDNSFWDGEGTDNEDDDDDDDDEDAEGDGEAAGEANDSKASAADKDGDADGDAEEEPQARGKKRKHDG